MHGAEPVFPRYGGQSLLNLPSTVCATLGASTQGLAPLLDSSVLPSDVLDGVSNLIVLLSDGLGRWQLDAAVNAGDAPTLAGLIERADDHDSGVNVATITSVFPSSTMPALATMNSGLSPATHGLLGWTVYLEEFREPAELARWGPAGGRGSFTDDELGGHDPVAFFGHRTLYRRLAASGVRSVVVGPASVHDSGFSQMVFQGAEMRGHYATSSIFVTIDAVLAESRGAPTYIYGYWPTVDTVSHHRGPDGVEHTEEVATLDFALGRWLAKGRRFDRTLMLITADHGHVDSRPDEVVRLDLETELLSMLVCRPTGERRLAYLHALPGRSAEVHRLCAERLGYAAELLDPNDAFNRELFGPGQPSQATRRRAGDLILLARNEFQFVCPFSDRQEAQVLLGNHGGLDPREMLVPLIAIRF